MILKNFRRLTLQKCVCNKEDFRGRFLFFFFSNIFLEPFEGVTERILAHVALCRLSGTSRKWGAHVVTDRKRSYNEAENTLKLAREITDLRPTALHRKCPVFLHHVTYPEKLYLLFKIIATQQLLLLPLSHGFFYARGPDRIFISIFP